MLNSWYDPIVNIAKKAANLGYKFLRPIISETYDKYASPVIDQFTDSKALK